MKKPETRLQMKTRLAILEEWPTSYLKKIHGGPFQDAGISDIIGCVQGSFISIEMKIQGGREPSQLQLYNIECVIKAGGIAGVAKTPEEAVSIIKKGLNSSRVK